MRRGARLAVDCTAAPPCTLQALALGADVAFQSGTKYLGGHSDLTAGVLSVARRDALWDELREVRYVMGSVIAAFEAWLLIRGIRTLFLRYERASANALAIARHFERHPRVARVLYPGLREPPGHAVAARQMTGGFGGMLSLLVARRLRRRRATWRGSRRCFVPATSLGGVESLIEHRRSVEGPHSAVPDNLRAHLGRHRGRARPDRGPGAGAGAGGHAAPEPVAARSGRSCRTPTRSMTAPARSGRCFSGRTTGIRAPPATRRSTRCCATAASGASCRPT